MIKVLDSIIQIAVHNENAPVLQAETSLLIIAATTQSMSMRLPNSYRGCTAAMKFNFERIARLFRHETGLSPALNHTFD